MMLGSMAVIDYIYTFTSICIGMTRISDAEEHGPAIGLGPSYTCFNLPSMHDSTSDPWPISFEVDSACLKFCIEWPAHNM